MEIFISLIYASLFLWVIYKVPFFRVGGVWRHAVAAIFGMKLLAALALTMLYTQYYTDRSTADIFKYFDDARVLFGALPEHPWDFARMATGINADAAELQVYYHDCSFWFKEFDHHLYNDNRTLIRFNAIAMLFSLGHFFVHNVFMSFLSLCGLMGIYKVFTAHFPGKKRELLAAVFLLPSVLLWTSGVMKEGLVTFAFGLAFYFSWKVLHEGWRTADIICLTALTGLLTITKYYVLFCAVPGIMYLLLVKCGRVRSHLLAVSISVLACCLAIIAGHWAGGHLDIIEPLAYKQLDFVRFSKSLGNVGSLIDVGYLEPSVIDFAVHAPGALFNSVFRPLPWELRNLLSVLPAIENILLVAMLAFATIRFAKPGGGAPLIVFSVIFFLSLNTLNGLVVPVVGALVRYKVPAMPFIFAAIVCVSDYPTLFPGKRGRGMIVQR